MAIYTEKSRPIEAVQWIPGQNDNAIADIVIWINDTEIETLYQAGHYGLCRVPAKGAIVRTHAGTGIAASGDWSVTEDDGARWIIKPDVFTRLYELVETE